eukprot:5930761-Ditylum_brightwellii.AAC.2
MGKTHEDQSRAWERWEEYASSTGLEEDIFLDGFSKGLRIKLMEAFAMALHEGRFLRKSYDTLAEGTVRGAISYVAQTFQENNCPNPTKDNDSKLGQLLSRQYK